MRNLFLCIALVGVSLGTAANAAVIEFTNDPFLGSTALTTPGRQVVGGEPSLSFTPGVDVFAFAPAVFGVNQIRFANDVAANLPDNANFIVLQTTDNDADPTTPFGAGNAANLIANRITVPGPGFFIYFNSGLNLPRLVYSTDLSENTSDLAVLARFANLSGDSGALAGITQAQAAAIPEPSSFFLLAGGGALLAGRFIRRRKTNRG